MNGTIFPQSHQPSQEFAPEASATGDMVSRESKKQFKQHKDASPDREIGLLVAEEGRELAPYVRLVGSNTNSLSTQSDYISKLTRSVHGNHA